MGISTTLSIKDRYLERPYNDDKGEYNTLTPFCVCIYIRAVGPLLYINKTGAPYSSARCGCEIFQVSSLGKAKCVNMYAGCFTTDSANITLFFEYSAPRECFYSVG